MCRNNFKFLKESFFKKIFSNDRVNWIIESQCHFNLNSNVFLVKYIQNQKPEIENKILFFFAIRLIR